MIERSEFVKYMNNFANEYSDFLAVKANVAAINKLLFKRGRGDELFQAIDEKIKEFKKNRGDL